MLYAVSPFVELLRNERPFEESVRFRTVGDMCLRRGGALRGRDAGRRRRGDCRGARDRAGRDARGADRVSEAAMEDRKKEGYF